MYVQAKYDESLLKEIKGKRTVKIPHENDCKIDLDENLIRQDLEMPENTEWDVVSHYTRLSQMNYGVDSGIYPLGSCTMKYNPKISEKIAQKTEVDIHPYQDESTVQGSLQIMYELQELLKEIGGMDKISLQPAAGAQGEFLGMLIAKKYFENKGEDRREVIVPDSAHGTNPASAVMAGFEVVEIPSNDLGMIDLEALKSVLSEKTAALMLTNPNTLGIFEKDIVEIAEIVHENGSLLYYDGANLNAIMGKTNPGKMDFDIVHFNLHKTFGTPHGGGGPGAGPVGVKEFLADYLPIPIVELKNEKYYLDYSLKNTIGKIKMYYGNFAVLLKAWVYIKLMGKNLEAISEKAVLNANYLYRKLRDCYDAPHADIKKHEFVLKGDLFKEKGIHTVNIAKRLLDYGIHAPTIYFPLIVDEAIMIEPTETETKASLDQFIDIMNKIHEECENNPDIVKNAPQNTSVKRIDEIKAARNPILTWKDM